MRTGLGEAWWSRVCEQAEESEERLRAASFLALCRRCDGQYTEAERIGREVLDVRRWVLGEEHPDTLMAASYLALSLSGQGRYADAERIEREVHDVSRRVLGEEHPDTLVSAGNLAQYLSSQRKYADGGADPSPPGGAWREEAGTGRGGSPQAEYCGQSGGVALGSREAR